MNIPYEKMSSAENPSSGVYLDEPVRIQEAPVRVRHFFVFSLFSAICLCPATGLIALAYSLKSSAKADVKFHDKARLYSRRALFWNLVSVIFAVASVFLVLAFIYYVNAMVQNDVYGNYATVSRADAQEIDRGINKIVQPFENYN